MHMLGHLKVYPAQTTSCPSQNQLVFFATDLYFMAPAKMHLPAFQPVQKLSRWAYIHVATTNAGTGDRRLVHATWRCMMQQGQTVLLCKGRRKVAEIPNSMPTTRTCVRHFPAHGTGQPNNFGER